ncbi:MAG: PD40 domain-containing protein [Caldilineaceae bacterium]|nr:PD40 domain-containing protein [Caldilineaceae bacterium]
MVFVVCAASLLSSRSAWAGAIVDGPNVRVTDSSLNGATIANVRLAEHNGTLYAVWEDDRDEGIHDNFSAVYFAKSTNGGASWGPNIRVSELPYDDWINHPDIAVTPDGTIWVVWHQFYDNTVTTVNDLRIAKSTDGGATWTVSGLANGPNNDDGQALWRARIVADASNGNVYVMSQLWNRVDSDQGTELFLLRHMPEAEEWEPAPTIINDVDIAGRMSGESLDIGAWLSLTARDGVVCAAWEDRGRNTEERQPIYGACSTDGGATFGANFKISGDDGIHPEIALGPDGELYAAYAIDTDAHRNIKLRLSTDLGMTWQPVRDVTNVDEYKMRDWVVAVDDNGQVVLAYVYKYFSSGDIYLSTSIDQGLNFSYTFLEDGQGEFPGSADQWAPALALGGTGENTRAYVAWEDDRNSDNEMWSVSLTLDGLPPTIPANVKITPAERALRVTWDESADASGIDAYRVYRATSADGPYTELTARTVVMPQFVDVELDGTTYFYRVAAVDNAGNTGLPSAAVSGAALAAGDPTFGGTLAYETGQPTTVRLRSLGGELEERTITDARQPRFALDGSRIYYRSQTSISSQPVEGGEPSIFFNAEGLVEYDLADNERYYATLVARNFNSTVIGGTCFVIEPHYGRPGANVYQGQYDLGSEIALSNDRKWMVFRTEGFCNVAAAGAYSPPKLCLVDLATSQEICLEGWDYRTPDFAPTGHWLAFSVDLTGQEEIWKAQVQADGSLDHFSQLSSGPEDQPSRAPSWSTDGNWIVFQRDVDPTQDEDWRLYVVRSDGVGLRSLEIAGEFPAWLGGGDAGAIPTGDATLHLPVLTR